MDCKDLMICDFVYVVRGYDKHLTIEKIKGIIADKDEPYPVTLFTGETVSLNDIKPIPLTDDILVKNGFVKTWNGDWQLKEYATIIISKDYYVKIFERSIRIYYVHELQHMLYAACVNKELVID